ncbi:MAG: hypothetical protein ACRCVJ_00015 [Clostridium sp.]|uniref:hypothetical protein n=1 Tax=Clostridium sp. TaxID=1506 RepID=UPI003F38BC31
MATKNENETKIKEKKKDDLSQISPELIALLTKQIKAELINEKPDKEVDELAAEEKMLNRKIKVTSISSGTVGVYLLNGNFIKWDKSGDVVRLKVEDIVNMNSVCEDYLKQPLLILEDDEVIEYLGLTEKYRLLTKVKNIDELLQLSKEEIAEILNALSKEMKEDIAIDVLRRIKNNEIDSMSMIAFLTRQLKLEGK